ncbi:uncharacterized protein LOC129809165 [Phlebotomus papatasi]|uniref:uncharacterized protein LOC129809165 n=1 Tax=Phlebotomus papatasi TaxID=29031 RepID=UPI0024839186|nr:uncharacterized protein LOC129809165 [Phlebotomus papatasi]
MKKTFKYRRNFLQTSLKSNILLEYPRFQDTYGLIHQDFKTLYPDDNENLVGLFQPDFQEKLQTLGNLNTITGQNKDWCSEIIATLCWITLLRPTGNGRGTKRPPLKRAFMDFIVFQSENEELTPKSSPTIIAQGGTRSDVRRFFVSVDGTLIVTNNTFIDAFDIFFKLHFVFEIKYEDTLRNFLTYLEYYVFKITDRSIPNTTVNKCRMLLLNAQNE